MPSFGKCPKHGRFGESGWCLLCSDGGLAKYTTEALDALFKKIKASMEADSQDLARLAAELDRRGIKGRGSTLGAQEGGGEVSNTRKLPWTRSEPLNGVRVMRSVGEPVEMAEDTHCNGCGYHQCSCVVSVDESEVAEWAPYGWKANGDWNAWVCGEWQVFKDPPACPHKFMAYGRGRHYHADSLERATHWVECRVAEERGWEHVAATGLCIERWVKRLAIVRTGTGFVTAYGHYPTLLAAMDAVKGGPRDE